ncbi:putative amidohydrolase [Streptomyces aurantiacus]|uniref:nitrilase-related carbon-nitrogen hydrolase n=1 Tax=Streptomyces aurantiacus TaxID=47760 RepID=UPI0027940EA5|nr:nitrilase-related carbon-nitrogen hydrolase [Streptomyces aurantiacus]MDQ0779659.1 putative amidohydrolase [Streptomyces aurantiacus]
MTASKPQPSPPPVKTEVTRVVCEQLAPRIGDLAYNKELALTAVRRALADRADIVVLPELVTSGYVFATSEEAWSTAITLADPFFADLSAMLAGTRGVVVLGFCQDAGDTLYNSAAVVDESGVRAVYRKTHLWDRETLFFTPGDRTPPVVDTAHGRIGVLICYDLEFAEMPRRLALAGADLIAVPTNWPLVDRPAGQYPAEIVQAQAAARANGVFIACADRGGVERGQHWTQGTAVINQYGRLTATATDAEPRTTADLFLNLSRDKAISPHNDLLGDRRPDIYAQETPLL